jgi:hypothetical protein
MTGDLSPAIPRTPEFPLIELDRQSTRQQNKIGVGGTIVRPSHDEAHRYRFGMRLLLDRIDLRRPPNSDGLVLMEGLANDANVFTYLLLPGLHLAGAASMSPPLRVLLAIMLDCVFFGIPVWAVLEITPGDAQGKLSAAGGDSCIYRAATLGPDNVVGVIAMLRQQPAQVRT